MLFIMQFIIAMAVLVAWLYMLVSGATIPDALTSVVTLILGFFFGSQITEMVNRGN